MKNFTSLLGHNTANGDISFDFNILFYQIKRSEFERFFCTKMEVNYEN